MDNARVVVDMARMARSSKVPFHVVVDVDLGLKRCGVEAGEPALALAQKLARERLEISRPDGL